MSPPPTILRQPVRLPWTSWSWLASWSRSRSSPASHSPVGCRFKIEVADCRRGTRGSRTAGLISPAPINRTRWAGNLLPPATSPTPPSPLAEATQPMGATSLLLPRAAASTRDCLCCCGLAADVDHPGCGGLASTDWMARCTRQHGGALASSFVVRHCPWHRPVRRYLQVGYVRLMPLIPN